MTDVIPLPLAASPEPKPRKPWTVYEGVVSFLGDRPLLMATNGDGEVFALAVVYDGSDADRLADALESMIMSLRLRL